MFIHYLSHQAAWAFRANETSCFICYPPGPPRQVFIPYLTTAHTSADTTSPKNPFAAPRQVFIHYLTATANDVCKEAKRQTVSAEDVLTALEDLEFGELVPALREALEGECAQGRGAV